MVHDPDAGKTKLGRTNGSGGGLGGAPHASNFITHRFNTPSVPGGGFAFIREVRQYLLARSARDCMAFRPSVVCERMNIF
jgi:hypothetical protein